MRPIFWKVDGLQAWYIWLIKEKDILEGEGCGPFLSQDSCWQAIHKIEEELE